MVTVYPVSCRTARGGSTSTCSPVEDPGRLVSLGTVLVLAPGDPLAAAARRRGVAVVEA
jgi:hypothetical protein